MCSFSYVCVFSEMSGPSKTKTAKKSKEIVAEQAVLPPRVVEKFDTSLPLDNSVFRRVGNWSADSTAADVFPVGELMEYSNPSSSFKEEDVLLEAELIKLREAAKVHRNVRKYAQSYIRPGMTMVEICSRLEAKTLELVKTNADWSNYLDRGYGFPTGCSLNHVAAHYSPNYGDKTVLTANDICKLDFGVHVGGRIVDCAFTIAFDPIFDPLIAATQSATNAGLRAAGIDARLGEIGSIIQETIESYEFVDKAGKSVAIKPCKNLNGHSMEPYRIHGGQSIPIVARSDFADDKMKEGTFYAIETFATTGKGYVVEDGECSHYMRVWDAPTAVPKLAHKGARQLLDAIDKQFYTLPFCRRWLDDIGQARHLMPLKCLVDSGLVQDYPPLVDVKGSFTSQMEHTIVLKHSGKEIVSRGDDF